MNEPDSVFGKDFFVSCGHLLAARLKATFIRPDDVERHVDLVERKLDYIDRLQKTQRSLGTSLREGLSQIWGPIVNQVRPQLPLDKRLAVIVKRIFDQSAPRDFRVLTWPDRSLDLAILSRWIEPKGLLLVGSLEPTQVPGLVLDEINYEMGVRLRYDDLVQLSLTGRALRISNDGHGVRMTVWPDRREFEPPERQLTSPEGKLPTLP